MRVDHAQSRGLQYAMELHNALTARPDMLKRLLARFGPDQLGVNFDTGNSFLAGNDPVEYLRDVPDRVIHAHIKDIPESQWHERGKVTGTHVGIAGPGCNLCRSPTPLIPDTSRPTARWGRWPWCVVGHSRRW